MAMTSRQLLANSDLKLPECGIPRPGDVVTWYMDSAPQEGLLVGHVTGGRPLVKNRHGFTFALESYDQIRLSDPSNRVEPNWYVLTDSEMIKSPFPQEKNDFLRILEQHIPPGPTYAELVQEIWYRGFEVFLVGGTVRDVLAGFHTNDVDLVTSMPLARALPLLTSMYRVEPTISEERGFVRLGGSPASGDPFIDLKNFVFSDPGTTNAVFASSFADDVSHRDFACNAVYYDPVNNALIDPTGRGISEAESKCLTLVCDINRPAFYRGQITIRFFKFLCRGFTTTSQTDFLIRKHYLPALRAMKRSNIINYTRTQLLSKSPESQHVLQLEQFAESIFSFGCGDVWATLFEPLRADILAGET